jgi:hypothetical protein
MSFDAVKALAREPRKITIVNRLNGQVGEFLDDGYEVDINTGRISHPRVRRSQLEAMSAVQVRKGPLKGKPVWLAPAPISPAWVGDSLPGLFGLVTDDDKKAISAAVVERGEADRQRAEKLKPDVQHAVRRNVQRNLNTAAATGGESGT